MGKLQSTIFSRKNILSFVQDKPSFFDSKEFQEEDLPPPKGSRLAPEPFNSTEHEEKMDSRIFLRFPDRIMEMDKGIFAPRDNIDPTATGYQKNRKWDI
jgi:hypothetical protein